MTFFSYKTLISSKILTNLFDTTVVECQKEPLIHVHIIIIFFSLRMKQVDTSFSWLHILNWDVTENISRNCPFISKCSWSCHPVRTVGWLKRVKRFACLPWVTYLFVFVKKSVNEQILRATSYSRTSSVNSLWLCIKKTFHRCIWKKVEN